MNKKRKNKLLLLALLILITIPTTLAFSSLKSGIVGESKNFLETDSSIKYDIIANLDGGSFEVDSKPEFTKMDNGNWLYKYKPVPTPTKLPVPVKDGCDFAGWTVSAKPDIQKEYSIPAWHKGNLNIKANWKVKGAVLMSGRMFNDTIERMSGFWDVTEIRFVKGTPNQSGTDVSEAHDGSIMANIEGNILTVASEGKIFANKDCSVMFDYSDLSRSLSIKTINFYNFDTSNVTDMYCMFGFKFWTSDGGMHPFRLEEINGIENWNTSKVTDMSFMFYNCSSLTSLDVSNFDTSQVTNMSSMFYYCSSLTSLDVSNFNTSKVTDMSNMFYNCSKLSGNITISNPNIKSYSRMFSYCSVISPAKFVVNYTSGCKSVAQKMVNTKSSKSNVVLGGMPSTLTNGYSLNVTLTMMEGFENVTEIHFEQKSGTLSGTDVSEANDGSIKARISGNILYVEANGEIFANEDCRRMFHNLGSGGIDGRLLNKIIFNNFNTSKVTDMSWMFNNCEKLTSLDVSNFNTSKVTDMSNMLQSCESLTNIKGLENFDTSQVTNMQQMFMTCNKLTSLDVSNFDTSKVTNMQYMFDDCSSLSSLNVSKFNTSNVTNMSYMFRFCEKLTSLDVSNFNTSKVTGMSCMFSGCKSLASLDVSNFDTSQVTNMSSMFYSCSSLSSLDVSNFNTSQVEYIKDMFNSCNNLSGEITIMNPNITNYYNGMFYNCSTEANTKFIVKYTDEATKAVAEKLVATKSANSNVFLYETSKLIDGKTFNEKFNSLLLPVETKSKVIFKKGNTTGLPSNAIDVSVAGDKSIMMYSGKDETNLKAPVPLNYQTIYIVSDKTIEFNEDSSSMFYMPNDFNGLSSITFDNIDTSNVTNMSRMFDDCNHLETINGLEKFDTSNVINMSKMFYNCSTDIYQDTEPNLKLNLNNWDISKVTNMDNMFTNSAYLSGEMTISNPNIASYSDIFKKCSTEPNAKFIVKYTDEATKAVARNMVNTKNPEDHVYLYEEKNVLLNGPTFKNTINDLPNFENVTEIRFVKEKPDPNGINVAEKGNIKAYINNNKLIVASENEIFANPNSNSLFEDFGNDSIFTTSNNKILNKITFQNFNTSDVKNMSYMFFCCNKLTNLNLENFNTSNVTNMSSMFYDCQSLQNINIKNFDTKNVINMNSMFKRSSLTTLDISNFNTQNVKDMSGMFYFCGNLINLNLNNINTQNVTDMSYMFTGCNKLTNLNLTNFNTSNITNMAGMFYQCKSLTNLNLNNFDTSNVTDMSHMFNLCKNLTSLNLNNFDTSNVTDMAGMFNFCKSLQTLYLHNFDTSNVTDMSDMFYNCENLKTIEGLKNFDMSNVSNTSHMLFSNKKLTGEINITNPNLEKYTSMFTDCSTYSNSVFKVNYKSNCKNLALKLIETKKNPYFNNNSNVILGKLIN